MNDIILSVENIPVVLDETVLKKNLGIKPGQTKFEKKYDVLAAQVLEHARPRAACRVSEVEIVDDSHVKVHGVTMTSTILPQKFSHVDKVFVFLSTEGLDLAHWAEGLTSNLDMVFAGALRKSVCQQYQAHLVEKIKETYGYPALSSVHPGYLKEWPIEQQEQLFEVVSPLDKEMGVKLLPSHLMYPAYCTSGIYFEAEKS